MQNKLQELTDKLYREGLSKGQQEAEHLLAKAKEEAAQIVLNARQEAGEIVEQAKKSATEARKNVEGEMKLAGRQTIATVKRNVEDIIIAKVMGEPAKAAMSDAEFVKSLIKTTIERFNPQAANVSLSVILPEAMRQSLQAFADEQARKQLSGGIEIKFDKTFKSGFKIGAKSDGFYISLTDKDFENLFGEYLRPQTRALLFGE